MRIFASHRQFSAAPLWPLFALLVLAGALSACSGAPGPFGKPVAGVSGKPGAPARIVLSGIEGAPVSVRRRLAGLLREAAIAEGLGAIGETKTQEPAYRISGVLSAKRERRGVAIAYVWDIAAPGEDGAHRIAGDTFVFAAPGRNDWDVADDDVLRRISRRTSTRLARWLTGRGFAFTTANIAPPADANRLADISARSAPPAGPAHTAPGDRPVSADISRMPGASARSGIAVAPVAGAGGAGNAALRRALRRALDAQGAELAQAPSRAQYTVDGTVQLATLRENRQSIIIEWRLRDGMGRVLGTVAQNNTVPGTGTTKNGWPATAQDAASAAAGAIMKLLGQAR